MQIDRRITNGLAWAGAVLVVAVPLADFAIRQAMPEPSPQVAVVQEQPQETVATPTPVAERPQVAQADVPETAAPEPAATVEPTTEPAASSSGNAVDSFLGSGRDLPSYISGGSSTNSPAAATRSSTTPAATAPSSTPTAQPATPAAQPAAPAVQPSAPATQTIAPAAQPQSTATVTRTPITLPTPVSQRPPSVPQSQVQQAPAPVVSPALQPPLIVDEPAPIYTADDLDDWESGPLSEFLANRGQARSAPAPEYDNDGFFLDEGPNNRRQESFPRAYGEGFYYPFSE